MRGNPDFWSESFSCGVKFNIKRSFYGRLSGGWRHFLKTEVIHRKNQERDVKHHIWCMDKVHAMKYFDSEQLSVLFFSLFKPLFRKEPRAGSPSNGLRHKQTLWTMFPVELCIAWNVFFCSCRTQTPKCTRCVRLRANQIWGTFLFDSAYVTKTQ